MKLSHNMAGRRQSLLALALVFLMCRASEARSVNLGQERAAASNFVCDACLQFSTEAQVILSDPDTTQEAVDVITQMTCQSLTPKLKQKCTDLVNAYVPDAISALQVYLGPEMCTETGLCIPELSFSASGLRARSMDRMVLPVADTKTCVLCQDFAKDALTYLGSNVTKSKIIVALHLACAKLEDISRQCDLLVDVYAPDLIEHLDHLTPEEFCEMTRLCKPAYKSDRSFAAVTGNDCAICQFVVLELKIKLRDPTTQARLVDVLLNGCERVQNHVDECKLIVAQYAPFILANLDTILDADTLCTKFKACPATVQKVEAVEPILSLQIPGVQKHHQRIHDHQHRHVQTQ